jgi:hypothetical protein
MDVVLSSIVGFFPGQHTQIFREPNCPFSLLFWGCSPETAVSQINI